jgi:hypothetical protein
VLRALLLEFEDVGFVVADAMPDRSRSAAGLASFSN